MRIVIEPEKGDKVLAYCLDDRVRARDIIVAEVTPVRHERENTYVVMSSEGVPRVLSFWINGLGTIVAHEPGTWPDQCGDEGPGHRVCTKLDRHEGKHRDDRRPNKEW